MDNVVLIHGLLRTKYSMRPLEKFLKHNNYNVINFNYNSRKSTVYAAAEELKTLLDSKNITSASFVCHSLGSFVFRSFAEKNKDNFKFGNSVLLGAPNQGAKIASILSKFRLMNFIFGINLRKLSIDKLKLFNPANICKIGNIKGRFFPNSDMIVRHSEMELENVADSIMVRCPHSYYMSSKVVKKQILFFLHTGNFNG